MKALLRIVLASVVVGTMCGCGGGEGESSGHVATVYVDRETLQTVELTETAEAPAVNPATGRRTLMPGLYCPQCKTWHPSPPLEVLQRDPAARQCPKCKGPLTTDGPHPTADL